MSFNGYGGYGGGSNPCGVVAPVVNNGIGYVLVLFILLVIILRSFI